MVELKLYYAPGACSLAPHIALEETGSAFEAVAVDTTAGEQNGPAYRRINPKSRVPALAVGDWVLTENPAILHYIALRFPAARLWPESLERQAEVMEWLAWIASTVHVAYAHNRRVERYASSEEARADVRALGLKTSRELWLTIERTLGPGPWVMGGEYTVADPYLLVFWMWSRGPYLGFDATRELPRWTDHARRMAQRPAVRRAFVREGLELPA